MKILFVRPHLFDARAADALEPLAFAVLSALTPPDVERRLCDERLAPIPLEAEADLVAITIETYTARRAYEIADRFRARRIPVVAGHTASASPTTTASACASASSGRKVAW